MALNSTINVVRQAPGAVPVRIPQVVPRCELCEGRLVLGVFFDGTGNNRDLDLPKQKHSNVARLYAAYPNDLVQGKGRLYIPGVGTPFSDVRDDGQWLDSGLGNGFGSKGEQRILYGVLGVFNAVDNWLRAKTRVIPGDFFTAQQIGALCCNSELRYSTDPWTKKLVPNIGATDLAALKALDNAYRSDPLNMHQKGGLLHDWPGRNKFRHEFFTEQVRRIKRRIDQTTRPKLVEIVVDVFGFSRGAAQARAFCNGLQSLCDDDGTLFGVEFGIRFLGIFDTVASVGIQVGGAGRPLANAGHMAWADPSAGGGITIHPGIYHCEHYVAMHENRASFPLDRATDASGNTPANVREMAFAGAHSDVGGGYAPGDQGKSRTGDSTKLSQVSLHYMVQAAQAVGVPLDTKQVLASPGGQGEGGDGYDSHALDPQLWKLYGEFVGSMPAAQSTQAYLLPYLVWQYRHLDNYQQLPFYASRGPNAISADDRSLIDETQNKFRGDIARARGDTKSRWWAYASPFFTQALANDLSESAKKYLWIDADVLPRIQAHPALSAAQTRMFEDHVHDSLAGFRAGGLQELTGRLHWRRVFYGQETAQLAFAQDADQGRLG